MWRNSNEIFKVQFLYHSRWRDIDDIFLPWAKDTNYETVSKTAWCKLHDDGILLKHWVQSICSETIPHEAHVWKIKPFPKFLIKLKAVL